MWRGEREGWGAGGLEMWVDMFARAVFAEYDCLARLEGLLKMFTKFTCLKIPMCVSVLLHFYCSPIKPPPLPHPHDRIRS